MEAPNQPSGEQAALHRTILSLNTDFNLNLQVPDNSIPPSKRRQQVRTEEEERVDKIYNRAKCLTFQSPSHLSTSIGRFREQAEDLIRDWTANKKQQQHADNPTDYPDPHGLSLGVEERAVLQKVLLSLLEKKTLTPRRSKPGPVPTNSSTRASPEFPSPEPKRCRERPGQLDSPGLESIDDIPVRTSASNRLPSAFPEDSRLVNGDSFSTSFGQCSKASFAAPILSTTTRGDISDSQTTVQTNFDSFTYGSQPSKPSRNSFQGRENGGVRKERAFGRSRSYTLGRVTEPTPLAGFLSQPSPVTPSKPPANVWRKSTSILSPSELTRSSEVSVACFKPGTFDYDLGTDTRCLALQCRRNTMECAVQK